MIPIPKLTHKQKAAAVTVAGIADFLQIMLIPALLPGIIADEIIDFFVAIILVAICGFKWQFVAAFCIELIPGLGLLPTWSAVVLTLPSGDPNAPGFDPIVRATPPPSRHAPIQVTAVAVPPVQAPPVQNRR